MRGRGRRSEGDLRPPLGARWLRNILSDAPDLRPYLPLVPRAFALAFQARIGVCDGLYVALAEREGCALLTTDDRLARAPGQSHPFITLLDSL
jgi:predicted nucleic acid-binding protein